MKSIWIQRSTLVAAVLAMTWTASMSHAGDRATTAAEARQPADDTGRNTRDRDNTTLTADKQSNSKADVATTRAIRRAIYKDKSLSTNAHNVKIITSGGVVTLRGPVASEEEKLAVAKKAERIHGISKVDNQLEVAKP